MLRELAHFIRHAPPLIRMQGQYSRAEFADRVTAMVDEQGFATLRRALVGDLRGRVLDIGCGTGASFRYFAGDAQVEAIEPEQDFRELAVRRAGDFAGRVRVSEGDAMQLAFPDGSFDAAVMSLLLCSVPSVERVVSEAFRVLRPGGQLRLLEHVRSDGRLAGTLMDLADPLWLRLNKQGCHLNRNPLGALRAAGFRIEADEPYQTFETAMPAFPLRRIRASRPA
jgi:ubiquinone/menaquinone biosynthesis C-methylase UbiE